MALENVIAYAIVLGLPVWLVAEEILRRIASHRPAPAAAPAGLERRAPEGAPAHAHVA